MINRFIKTGFPAWQMYQTHLYKKDEKGVYSPVQWHAIIGNEDVRFYYTHRGDMGFVEEFGPSYDHFPAPTRSYRQRFKKLTQFVADVVCQLRWDGTGLNKLPKSHPPGWTEDPIAVNEPMAVTPKKRSVKITSQLTPLEDLCYSVAEHLSETYDRSSLRLSSLLALVDISVSDQTQLPSRNERNSANQTQETSRSKRGLQSFMFVNGVKAVWSLFGFVEKIRTNRRLNRLEKEVARNAESVDQLSKEVASHSIALAQLNLITQDLARRLDALTNRVDVLEQKVAALEAEVKIQQILSLIDSLINRAQDALDYGFIKLESIVHGALLNQASAFLLPPDIIREIQTHLSKQSGALVDNNYDHMKSIITSHPDDSSSLLAIVNIAAVSRRSRELVRLTAMPSFKGNVALVPILDYNIVLLDQENGVFTVIEDTEYTSCLEDHCVMSNPELPTTGSTCGIPQLLGRTPEACSFEEVPSDDGLFLKRLMTDGVIFSVKDEATAQIFCDSQASKIYKISGLGTVNLPAGCSLVITNKAGKTAKMKSLPVSQIVGLKSVDLIVAAPEQIFQNLAEEQINGTSSMERIINAHIERLNEQLGYTDSEIKNHHRNVIILSSFLGLTLAACIIISALLYRYSTRFRAKVILVKEDVRQRFDLATEKLLAFERKMAQRDIDSFNASFPTVPAIVKRPGPEVPPHTLKTLMYKLDRMEGRACQSDGYLSLSEPLNPRGEEIYQNASELHYAPDPQPRVYPYLPSSSEITAAKATLVKSEKQVEASAPEASPPPLTPKKRLNKTHNDGQ